MDIIPYVSSPSTSTPILLARSISVVYLIFSVLHPAAPQVDSSALTLSIDCGLSKVAYKDSAGITWETDGVQWPSIANISVAVGAVTPPEDLKDLTSLTTLRYFPSTITTNNSFPKFCYELEAVRGSFYLLRATFWIGSARPDGYPTPRNDGVVSFRVIVDTYAGVEVKIRVPQTSVWFEEMYVKAVGSSVSLCLSTASNSSDTPFNNAVELRELGDFMQGPVAVNESGIALRMLDRQDFGTLSTAPPFVRYPHDHYDRLWFRSSTSAVVPEGNTLSMPINVTFNNDYGNETPSKVMETCLVASTLAGYVYDVTTDLSDSRGVTVAGSHKYFFAYWFTELDPRVNASGLRVFNFSINDDVLYSALDVFEQRGALYMPYQTHVTNRGTYADHIKVVSVSVAGSRYPATIAALEILQYLDGPIASPTASPDVSAMKDLVSSVMGVAFDFLGDPCLPSDYRYTWIGCSNDPPRVTSISLSDFNPSGNHHHPRAIPATVNNLDAITQIVLSGNALEGPLPDFSNLTNLQLLDLSNNNLNGPIPYSLTQLPRLSFINLENNNFSGRIPASLEEKQLNGMIFKYDGNSFLCSTTNATCASSPSDSSANNATKKNKIPLIVGAVASVCFLVFVVIVYLYKRKRNKPNPLEQAATTNCEDDHPHGNTNQICSFTSNTSY